MLVITVARKPPNGSVVDSALKYGTGTVNIDACRIPRNGDSMGGGDEKASTISSNNGEAWDNPWKHDPEARERHAATIRENVAKAKELGGFPMNVLLSHVTGCTKVDGGWECVNGCPVKSVGVKARFFRQFQPQGQKQ